MHSIPAVLRRQLGRTGLASRSFPSAPRALAVTSVPSQTRRPWLSSSARWS